LPVKKDKPALNVAGEELITKDQPRIVPPVGQNLGSLVKVQDEPAAKPKKKPAKTKPKSTVATPAPKKRGRKASAEKQPPPQDQAAAAAVVASLKAKYKGKVFYAHEYTMPWILKRLPTGILGLDLATGGGLPAGGFTMIYGPEGIGKNYVANRVMAHQQQFYGGDCNLAVVSTEMPYDKQFGKGCGVEIGFSELEIRAMDLAYFELSGDHFTEDHKKSLRLEIGTFITVPPTTAEEAFDIALDLINSRKFQVVVFDSFGSLLIDDDKDKSMQEEAKVGGPSGVNTRFARKLNSVLGPDAHGNPNMTCVIGINQVRDNMDRANKYSAKTHESGGWALKHTRWVGIELAKLGKIREGGKDGPLIGKSVGWKITKQKAGGHEGHSGNYDFIYKRCGIWREFESLRVAVDLGIVKKSGSWLSYNEQNLGQGLSDSAKFVQDTGMLIKIEEEVFAAVGIRCNYVYRAQNA
jgi:recombination protein RecA